MKTVHEVSRITGVSVRTLHHYDSIGLLKPSAYSESGYRLYSDDDIVRLHCIMMFKELQFSLADIGKIIDSPEYDRQEALRRQLELLEMKKRHIEDVIDTVRDILQNGGKDVDFSMFDNSAYENYADEIREKWGSTEAYKESAERSAGRSKKENAAINDGMIEIFAQFGRIKDKDPASEDAVTVVRKLKDYISENYYACSMEMLKSICPMYTDDERFRKNIDAVGGEGTARFARNAIELV